MRTVLAALAVLTVVSCGGSEAPTPAGLEIFDVPATATPSPEPTPTPDPTARPDPTERVGAIVGQWVSDSPDTVAQLVADAVVAAADEEDRIPSLLRVSFGRGLKVAVENEIGDSLAVELQSVSRNADGTYSATVVVSGTVVLEIGPFDAIDLSVPIIGTVDTDSEQATTWTVAAEQVDVTFR